MSSPFFIVGSGRCGSTLAYTVLSAHPQIALTNEAGVLEFLNVCMTWAAVPRHQPIDLPARRAIPARGIVDGSLAVSFATALTAHAKTVCEELYQRCFEGRAYRWWGDKLPDPRAAVNARRLWPDARYLVLIRDPRDVLCSWRAYGLRSHMQEHEPEVAELDAEAFARSWDAIYRGLAEHLAGASITVRYRDLTADPQRELTRTLAMLGLSWTAETAAALATNDTFAEHGTSVDVASSAARWERDLPAADRAVIEEICGEVMREFGYLE